jgi:hypothetical protein
MTGFSWMMMDGPRVAAHLRRRGQPSLPVHALGGLPQPWNLSEFPENYDTSAPAVTLRVIAHYHTSMAGRATHPLPR